MWKGKHVSIKKVIFKEILNWKEKNNLKVESYDLLGNLTEDYSTKDSLVFEEQFQRSKGEARMYRRFCWEENVVKHQMITANHKKQTSRVNDFSAFSCRKD